MLKYDLRMGGQKPGFFEFLGFRPPQREKTRFLSIAVQLELIETW